MKQHILSRTLLGVSGGLLLFIGARIMTDPLDFLFVNGIHVPSDISLASELRAPSGILMTSGLFMLSGILHGHLRAPALAMGGFVYGNYGLSRLIGTLVDGLPSEPLTQAMVVELLIGALCLIAAYRVRSNDHKLHQFGDTTPVAGAQA